MHKYSCFLMILFISSLTPGLLATEKPNVVFIFVDDLGWKDIACYGNQLAETPHIDQLAADGMKFTDFYAAGAVCSPCLLYTSPSPRD